LLTLTVVLLLAGVSISTLFAFAAAEQARAANWQRENAEASAEREKALAGKEAQARADAEKLARERAAALKEVAAEKRKVESELAKAEFVAYAFRLREAQTEIERGRLEQAEAVLGFCDPKLRGWEHGYLLRQTQPCHWLKRDTGGLRLPFCGVTSVAISPDGKCVISGSQDGTVEVWTSQTGKVALSLKGHMGEVTSVAISRDGTRIISGSKDQTVKIWDVATGKNLLISQWASETCDERSDQQRWQTYCKRQRGGDGEGLGRNHRESPLPHQAQGLDRPRGDQRRRHTHRQHQF
jgi:hypothetical protein